MSQNYRGNGFKIVTALFILVIFAFLVAGIYDLGREHGETIGKNVANTATYAKHTQEDIKECLTILNDMRKAECIREVIESTNEQKRAEDDLVAQTEMSLWALWMLIITSLMAFVTAVGVYFVWRTLETTQKMAEDSRDMAKDASRSADAAIKTAEITEKAMLGLERPLLYPVIETTPIDPDPERRFRPGITSGRDGDIIMCSSILGFTNLGRSPAICRSMSYKISVRGEPDFESLEGDPGCDPRSADAIIQPGATFDAFREQPTIPVNGQDFNDIQEKGDIRFWVYGIIKYSDAFGTTYKRYFWTAIKGDRYLSSEYGGAKYNYEEPILPE